MNSLTNVSLFDPVIHSYISSVKGSSLLERGSDRQLLVFLSLKVLIIMWHYCSLLKNLHARQDCIGRTLVMLLIVAQAKRTSSRAKSWISVCIKELQTKQEILSPSHGNLQLMWRGVFQSLRTKVATYWLRLVRIWYSQMGANAKRHCWSRGRRSNRVNGHIKCVRNPMLPVASLIAWEIFFMEKAGRGSSFDSTRRVILAFYKMRAS